MKKNLFLLFFVLLLAACQGSPSGSAYIDPQIPILTTSTGWVIDTTGKLGSDNEKQLEALAEEIRTAGFQVGIAVFSDCASEPIQLATTFGNTNGLGSGAKDNGIAIVILVDKKGRDGKAPAISVAIGSNLEAVLTDGKVGRILDATYVPDRKSQQWQRGTVKLLTGLRDFLTGTKGIEEFQSPPTDYTALIIASIVLLIVWLAFDGFFFGFELTLMILQILATASGDDDSSSSTKSSGGGSSSLGGGGSFRGGGASR